MICLTLDLDGTIVHRLDPIDPELVILFKQFNQKGAKVAFVTGRMFSFAHRALKDLDFPYYLALQNGADILKMPGKLLLQRNYLKIEPILLTLKKLQVPVIFYSGFENGDFCYYQKSRFTPQELVYLEELKKINPIPWKEFFELEEIAHLSVPLIKFFGKEKDLIPLIEIFKGYSAQVIKDSVDPAQSILLLTAPCATKGDVVKFLREKLHATSMIAAGDDRNDISMFLQADYGIAMADAPSELKEVAHEVVSETLKKSLRKFLP
jgi:hydroxymethylpyrimidine pyrophosphatase-like HAD family hydrolase